MPSSLRRPPPGEPGLQRKRERNCNSVASREHRSKVWWLIQCANGKPHAVLSSQHARRRQTAHVASPAMRTTPLRPTLNPTGQSATRWRGSGYEITLIASGRRQIPATSRLDDVEIRLARSRAGGVPWTGFATRNVPCFSPTDQVAMCSPMPGMPTHNKSSRRESRAPQTPPALSPQAPRSLGPASSKLSHRVVANGCLRRMSTASHQPSRIHRSILARHLSV